MDCAEKDTMKMAAKLLMGKNKRSSGQPIQKTVSMAISIEYLKQHPHLIKELSEEPYLKRTQLPTKEEFTKWIRESTTLKELIEKTGIKKTTVEHWFRKDKYFSYPTVEEWLIIKEILKPTAELDHKMTHQENKDWK